MHKTVFVAVAAAAAAAMLVVVNSAAEVLVSRARAILRYRGTRIRATRRPATLLGRRKSLTSRSACRAPGPCRTSNASMSACPGSTRGASTLPISWNRS